MKIDLQFNLANVFNHTGLQQRKNYELDLNRNYNTIYQGFNKNRKRILKKVKACIPNLKVQPISATEFFKFYKEVSKKYVVSNYMLRSLLNLLTSRRGYCLGVCKNEKFLGALYYFRSKNRIYYLVPVATQEGYGLGVSSLMIDFLIEEHQQKKIILDFEGSMVENVARFYRSFGAKPECYASLSLFRGL